MMQIGDLGKAFTLWVDAAGCVTVATTGRGVHGSLPVFSVETHDQASALQIRHCRLARDGTGLYFLNDTPRGVDDLGKVSDLFRATYNCGRAPLTPDVRAAALKILDLAESGGE